MQVTIPLTDDEVRGIRFWSEWGGQTDITPEYRPQLSSLIRGLEAKLPKRIDPRTLPPGPELDELVCRAMGTWACTSYGVCEHNYSSAMGFVGRMLDWLHEQRTGAPLALANWGLEGKPPWRITLSILGDFYGQSPQHALAIAVAVVGGNDV